MPENGSSKWGFFSRFFLVFLLVAFLGGLAGIGAMAFVMKTGTVPAADGYPYDMYEREFPKLMEHIKQGDSSGLTITEATGLFADVSTEEYALVKTFYGKVKDYKIRKTVDCRRQRYYYVELHRIDGGTSVIRICLWVREEILRTEFKVAV